MDNSDNKELVTSASAANPASRLLILLVVISLVFGLVGGAVGSYWFLSSPGGKKLLGSSPLKTQRQSLTVSEDSAVIDAVKTASPAVVSIVVSKDLSKIPGYGNNPFETDPFFGFFFGSTSSRQQPDIQQVGAGSGFLVSADGLILTNKHVVSDDGASYTVLTQDGKKYDAKVMAKDTVDDLAIVKIEIANAPFLKMADSKNLQIGQRVIAIGNSLGQYQNTVTSGIVSGVGRKITAGSSTGSEQLSGVIQTDAAINPGNSGGPLLNLSGEVVGINTAVDMEGQLVGFAIPSNDAQKALESFNKNGKIARPFLGVRYMIISDDLAKEQKLPKDFGALVVRGNKITDFAVMPGSPADKAGIVENDIILEVNGQKVYENHGLSELLKDYNIGDSVNLKIYHKGQEKIVTVTLGEAK